MNVFRLLQLASERLKTNDALFHEQADTVLGILRSAGVLPFKRSSLNGSLHKQVAGYCHVWTAPFMQGLI